MTPMRQASGLLAGISTGTISFFSSVFLARRFFRLSQRVLFFSAVAGSGWRAWTATGTTLLPPLGRS